MNLFYQWIDIRNCKERGDWDQCPINYQGIVFTGVSFRGQKGSVVDIAKQSYKRDEVTAEFNLESNTTSLVCGKETGTSSGWMPIGGPIKGFYVSKNGEDLAFDYISDFGVYVEDPCQAVDDMMNIDSDPQNKTVKDLKYHAGTDS